MLHIRHLIFRPKEKTSSETFTCVELCSLPHYHTRSSADADKHTRRACGSVKVTESHWKWYHSTALVRFPISAV